VYVAAQCTYVYYSTSARYTKDLKFSVLAKHFLIGPTLPDLFRLKIHQRVGDRYQLFGVLLLNDKDGTKVASLDHQHKGKCEGIVMDILREWIQGNGVPSTWPELVQALNESDLNDLAKEVATRYSVN
jgi:hypothetical protein